MSFKYPFKYIVFIEDEVSAECHRFDDPDGAFEFYEDEVDTQIENCTKKNIAIYRMMKFDKSIL